MPFHILLPMDSGQAICQKSTNPGTLAGLASRSMRAFSNTLAAASAVAANLGLSVNQPIFPTFPVIRVVPLVCCLFLRMRLWTLACGSYSPWPRTLACGSSSLSPKILAAARIFSNSTARTSALAFFTSTKRCINLKSSRIG